MKRILDGIAAVGLVCMFFITVVQVVFRVFLKISTAWSDELSQYAFAFIVFVGAASVSRDDGHITIAIVPDRISEKPRRLIRFLGRIIVLPFILLYIIGAFQNAVSTWDTGIPSAEWMHIGYMYGILFLSGVIMLGYLLRNGWYDLSGKKSSSEVSAKRNDAGGVL
ncbi:MAG TPA: TRAP transporter small permease [Spirochaetales bacterium]|nr:TRAP transporter small permease [Spirochaetales bacterium]HOV37943.1 TRAP transporter small permease [Spirochaetales bacterium]